MDQLVNEQHEAWIKLAEQVMHVIPANDEVVFGNRTISKPRYIGLVILAILSESGLTLNEVEIFIQDLQRFIQTAKEKLNPAFKELVDLQIRRLSNFGQVT